MLYKIIFFSFVYCYVMTSLISVVNLKRAIIVIRDKAEEMAYLWLTYWSIQNVRLRCRKYEWEGYIMLSVVQKERERDERQREHDINKEAYVI